VSNIPPGSRMLPALRPIESVPSTNCLIAFVPVVVSCTIPVSLATPLLRS
jgi:hypothetical protein